MANLNSHERRALMAAVRELHALEELCADLDVVPSGWETERLSSFFTGRRGGKIVYSTMLAFERECA